MEERGTNASIRFFHKGFVLPNQFSCPPLLIISYNRQENQLWATGESWGTEELLNSMKKGNLLLEGPSPRVKWTLQALNTFHAKLVGSLGCGDMPRGANHQIRFFLSTHILTKPFPRRITVCLTHSPSPTNQDFSAATERNLPNQLQQYSSGKFRYLAFVPPYFLLKIPAELTHRAGKGWAFPCQLPTWFLCVSPALSLGACVWCSAQTQHTKHLLSELGTEMTQHLELFLSPWTFSWPLALPLQRMTHPQSEWSDPTRPSPSQLWHFPAVTAGFLLSTGPTVLCTLVGQLFWFMTFAAPASFVYSSICDAAAVQDIKVMWVLGLHKLEASNSDLTQI